jgi:hypothetical protein
MLAAAERARVKHMVQFTNRGLPHYRWIKHLLEDGYIGMPYHAYFTWPTGWYPAQQPNSKIVGIRRGQSAAEELAVPDSYFAGADRGRPFSIRRPSEPSEPPWVWPQGAELSVLRRRS